MSSNAACWKFTFALSSTYAERIKAVGYILLSANVSVLPYYILL